MTDRLRPLWDFDDLHATEQRFRAVLEDETLDARKGEILTQLARVEGLRGDFDGAERLLADAEDLAGPSAVAEARVYLERGRVHRSRGDTQAALPLFESAFELAKADGELFLAVDAAHMAALVAPDREGMLAWTERGIDLADGEAQYWLGPLLNNLGWTYYEAAEYEPALEAFRRALTAREQDPQKPEEIEIARYAVGRTLRALGRPAEAAALLEQAVAWTVQVGKPDAWFHEELAEDYAALGRDEDARTQAELALALVPEADGERAARLRALAGAAGGG